MSKSCIMFCRCSAGIVPDQKLEAINKVVSTLDAPVFELHDLCALTIDRQNFLQEIESTYEKKIVIACYPRAVEKMLVQADVPFTGLQVLNFRELSVDAIQDNLSRENSFSEGNPDIQEVKSSLEVPAWFPVIDQGKCTSCGQCARFCLFGVYRFLDKKLEVVNPLNCKNLCPACGRTCPTSAIIFPRLKEDSVLSGAEPGQIKIDLSLAQEGNMLSMLQQRSQNRRSILKSGIMELAEEERRKALEQFKINKL